MKAYSDDPIVKAWRARAGFVAMIFQGVIVLGEMFFPHEHSSHLTGWVRVLVILSPGILTVALLAPEIVKLASKFVPHFGTGKK